MSVFRQTKGVAEERSESRSFRIIPLICASFTIALGLLTFIGWISGLPLLASVRAKYIPMAPMTALNFVFIATGLLALTGKQPAKFAGPLGALATVIGAVVLVGYWYGTPLLYGGHAIPVALSTACGFFLSGIGIVMAAGATGWPLRAFLGDSTRALLLRAFVPLIPQRH